MRISEFIFARLGISNHPTEKKEDTLFFRKKKNNNIKLLYKYNSNELCGLIFFYFIIDIEVSNYKKL